MPVSPSTQIRNKLLASLPPGALQALLPDLELVSLPLRQQLYQPETLIETGFFIEAGMISLVSIMEDGSPAEVGIIGSEGALGVSVAYGIDTPFIEAMVQLPGEALRMEKQAFQRHFESNSSFRTALLRYTEALQAQIMQTAACNGRHSLEQRFARWLLMAQDRSEQTDLPLTQEFMAMMLGVQRTSITSVASYLNRAGIINYGKGKLTVKDRSLLEAASCECYDVVRRRYATLIG